MAKPAKPPDPLKRRHLVEEALPAPRALADRRGATSRRGPRLRRARRSSRRPTRGRPAARAPRRRGRAGRPLPGARDRGAARRGAGRRRRGARVAEAADAAGQGALRGRGAAPRRGPRRRAHARAWSARRARDPHRERPLPQPAGRLLPHPARAPDGGLGAFGLGQVDARLRHALRRGPAALRHARSPPTRASSSSACRAPRWTRSRTSRRRSRSSSATRSRTRARRSAPRPRSSTICACCSRSSARPGAAAARRRPNTVESVAGRARRSASPGRRISLGAPLPAVTAKAAGALRDRLVAEGYGRLLLPRRHAARRGGALAEGVRAAARRGAAADRPAGAGPRAGPRAPRRGGGAGLRAGRGPAPSWCPAEGAPEEIREGFACARVRAPPRDARARALLLQPRARRLRDLRGLRAHRRPSTSSAWCPIPARTLAGKAIAPFATPGGAPCQRDLLRACRAHGVPTDVPWRALDRRPAPLRRRGRRRQVVRRARLLRVARGAALQGAGAHHDRALPALRSRAPTAAARACAPTRSRCSSAGATSARSRASRLEELADWLAGLALDERAARARRARSWRALLERTRTALRVGPRLPRPRPPGAHALGRRGAAHPARHRARRRAHRLALRARRALDRPPRARRRAPARGAAGHPRPRQHRRGGGARAGDRGRGRSPDRPRARARAATAGASSSRAASRRCARHRDSHHRPRAARRARLRAAQAAPAPRGALRVVGARERNLQDLTRRAARSASSSS